MTVFVQPTEYEVTAYPYADPERNHFTLKVAWRGADRWAITRTGECYDFATGGWSYESLPSNRVDSWLETHRAPLEEALERARELAPELTINGYTVTQAIRLHDGETFCAAPIMSTHRRCNLPVHHEGDHAQ